MNEAAARRAPSPLAVPAPAEPGRAGGRSVLVVTADGALRHAVVAPLRALRWAVREAAGAAAMFASLEQEQTDTVILDSWLPDLDVRECVGELGRIFPSLDVLTIDGTDVGAAPTPGPYRGELLHALRQTQAGLDAPAWQNSLPTQEILRRHGGSGLDAKPGESTHAEPASSETVVPLYKGLAEGSTAAVPPGCEPHGSLNDADTAEAAPPAAGSGHLPRSSAFSGVAGGAPPTAGKPGLLADFIGSDPQVLEVSRRVQLVAKRKTAVLIHGPTGTGKELVARAIHRLSERPAARFVAINCAAIPEALIEAELFGYARGAFTGALQSRCGRIEAAAGGTVFLDEVGELSLAAQSKLLRFLESGEVQRVGENETIHVDVRIVAATHRRLGAMAAAGEFRLDLLHRLSVFLVQTPPLADRHEDMDTLIARTLVRLGAAERAKQLSEPAQKKLHAHGWPGNVRELEHTLERAWILAGDDDVIGSECVEFGDALL